MSTFQLPAAMLLTVVFATAAVGFAALWWRSRRSLALLMRRASATANLVVMADSAGNAVWLNAAYTERFGSGLAKVLGRPVLGLLGAIDPMPELERAVSAGEGIRTELRCRSASGRPLWLQVGLYPEHNRRGRLLGFMLVASDITTRVEASQRLEQTLDELARERARLDSILDGARAGTWVLNLRTGMAHVNERWAAMLGYPLQELAPLTFDRVQTLIHPEDRLAADDLMRRHLRGEVPHFEIEQRLRHKDGQWHWLLSRAMVVEWAADGKPASVAGMHIDIGPRKAQEAALEAQRRKLSTVIASVPGVVFECEMLANGRFHFPYISDSLQPRFGLEPAAVMADAELLFSAIDPDDRMRLREAVRVSADGMSPLRAELRLRGNRGQIWAGLHSLPQRRDDGSLIWHGMLLDISARKHLDEQLQLTTARAEQANRAKSAFLATMSHEIRTPMNGVLGVAELLMHTRDPDEQRDGVRTIRDSGLAMLRIIDDILDFSKIEADRIDLERVPVDLPALVQGVCDTLAASETTHPVALRLFIAPELPDRIWSDPTRLRQVLNNLVGNAVKFCGADPMRRGRVSVRLTCSQDTPAQLQLAVQDNGIGIDADAVGRLFTPFTQAEASTTRRFGGTGLGLAITQRLVALMEGRIAVDSTPGVGSTFTVLLPLQATDDQPAREQALLAGLDCITLADSPGEQEDLRAYLEPAGARVHAVADLAEAAVLAAALAPPVVLVHDLTEAPTQEELQATFADISDVRHLLVGRGRRAPTRILAADFARLGSLRRLGLLRGVAMAAGRVSPEVLAPAELIAGLGTAEQGPSTARPLILVAEDDAVNQIVIRRQLALLGYEAEVVGDGRQALQLWRSGRFALLLTDLHMPDTDGYTLVRQVRAEEGEALPRRPVLALTANALKGEEVRAMTAGIDACLTKPVALATLQSALAHWLRMVPPPVLCSLPGPNLDGPPGALPVLDLGVLQRLLGNDTTGVREFLQHYREAAGALATELSEANAANDLQRVAGVAQRFKAMSRSVGALELGMLCDRIERFGLCGDRVGLARLRQRFETTMGEVMLAVDQQLSQVLP